MSRLFDFFSLILYCIFHFYICVLIYIIWNKAQNCYHNIVKYSVQLKYGATFNKWLTLSMYVCVSLYTSSILAKIIIISLTMIFCCCCFNLFCICICKTQQKNTNNTLPYLRRRRIIRKTKKKWFVMITQEISSFFFNIFIFLLILKK